MKAVLTTREAGDEIKEPEWLVRRVADCLSPPVERFGHKRMIPRERLAEIRQAIAERREHQKGGEVNSLELEIIHDISGEGIDALAESQLAIVEMEDQEDGDYE